jgi:hypothetical protein
MHLPVIAGIHVGQGRCNTPLSHDGMGLAQQGLTHETNRDALRRRLDRRTQPGSASADDKNVVFMRFVPVH